MKPDIGFVCLSDAGQKIFQGLHEVLPMEAEFFIPLLRNNALIGDRRDILDTFRKQPNVFVLKQDPVVGDADLDIRIAKCLELLQLRNADDKRRFNIQPSVITAACAMSFHRPDMLVLKQNALIFRSDIARTNSILYLLDAGEELCRICRIGLLDFEFRPYRAVLRVIDRKLAALAARAHGQKRFVSTLLQFQLQRAVIMAANLLDVRAVPEYEAKAVAACGERYGHPCVQIRCGQYALISGKLRFDLTQNLDGTF